MAYAPDIHVAVYQVLDEVIDASVAPPGAAATIHSIIDDLRAACAPDYMIAQAESISVQLHRLKQAVAQSDTDCEGNAKQELRAIAAAWIDQRIRH